MFKNNRNYDKRHIVRFIFDANKNGYILGLTASDVEEKIRLFVRDERLHIYDSMKDIEMRFLQCKNLENSCNYFIL